MDRQENPPTHSCPGHNRDVEQHLGMTFADLVPPVLHKAGIKGAKGNSRKRKVLQSCKAAGILRIRSVEMCNLRFFCVICEKLE